MLIYFMTCVSEERLLTFLVDVVGAFLGCSLEGNVVATRAAANASFYGDSTLTAIDILMGQVAPPRAAAPLYSALSHLFAYR